MSWPNLALLTVTDHTAMTLFSVPVCLRGHSTPYSLSLTTNSEPILVIYCCVTYYPDLASKQHSFIIPLFIWSGIWTPLSYFLCFSIPYKAVITVSTRAGVSSETTTSKSARVLEGFSSLEVVKLRTSGSCWLLVSCHVGLFTWQLTLSEPARERAKERVRQQDRSQNLM